MVIIIRDNGSAGAGGSGDGGVCRHSYFFMGSRVERINYVQVLANPNGKVIHKHDLYAVVFKAKILLFVYCGLEVSYIVTHFHYFIRTHSLRVNLMPEKK